MRKRISYRGKGESSTLSGGAADDQGNSKPWCSNTNKFDEGSLNGIPVCHVQQKKRLLREKVR
jgi:hypothetical protein